MFGIFYLCACGVLGVFCCLVVLFKHRPRNMKNAMERVSGSSEKPYYSPNLQKVIPYFKHHGKYIVTFKAFFTK